MDDDFDEFGNFVGQEYSDSASSDGWEDSDVEVVENEYDAQGADVPLVGPPEAASDLEVSPPADWAFRLGLMRVPALARYFAVVGGLRQGKTALCRLLGDNTPIPTTGAAARAIDAVSGQSWDVDRGLTLKPVYSSSVRQARGKSYALSYADTPGHADFATERATAAALSDGTLLVVDCVEGSALDVPATPPSLVVFTKLDRLFLDLRLPPAAAFERLDHLITQFGTSWDAAVFTSAKLRFAFTLASVSKLYRRWHGSTLPLRREHVAAYVLAPVYKLVGCGLVGHKAAHVAEALDIRLSKAEWALAPDERMALLLARYFEDPLEPLVRAIVDRVPPPQEVATRFVTSEFGRIGTEEGAAWDGPAWLPLGSKRVRVEDPPSGAWVVVSGATPEPLRPAATLLTIALTPGDTAAARLALDRDVAAMAAAFPGLALRDGVVCGPGELYLDTALGMVKTRASQPLPEFRETVSAESYAAVPTKGDEVEMTVIARPATDEDGASIVVDDEEYALLHTYRGCRLYGANPPSAVRHALLSGFESVVASGPLTESRVTGVAFIVLALEAARAFQVAWTARRACCAAVLLAAPRLVEPLVRVAVLGRLAAGKAMYGEAAKRSAEVVLDEPVLGTNLYVTACVVPVVDSLGLELDVLCQLAQRDDARVTQRFEAWRTVPGDPLDATQAVGPREVAENDARARDFVLRLRRRRGLDGAPDLAKFVDEDMVELLT